MFSIKRMVTIMNGDRRPFMGSMLMSTAIRLPRTCWKTGTIFALCRNCLGTKDVSTTMIYTHVLNRGGRGVTSPSDRL
jgi:hypothetical protein